MEAHDLLGSRADVPPSDTSESAPRSAAILPARELRPQFRAWWCFLWFLWGSRSPFQLYRDHLQIIGGVEFAPLCCNALIPKLSVKTCQRQRQTREGSVLPTKVMRAGLSASKPSGGDAASHVSRSIGSWPRLYDWFFPPTIE